jgi:KaiC/GvpD/RAD55 family RecA-like ATPase
MVVRLECPERGSGGLSVPVPGGRRRRYRLVILIGQSDGRLSVIRAPVTIERSRGIGVAGPSEVRSL